MKRLYNRRMSWFIVLSFILLTVVLSAFAADFDDDWPPRNHLEIGLGLTRFDHQSDGIWFQGAFPYELKTESPSISLGLTGEISDNVRWHAGYMYLGKVWSRAIATASDDDYAANGANAKWTLSYWYGRGSVQSLYATIAPEIQIGQVAVSLELGPTLYKPSWKMEIQDWRSCFECPSQPLTVIHDARTQIGAVFGVGVKHGHTTFLFSRWLAEAKGDDWPAIYVDGAFNLSVRTEF